MKLNRKAGSTSNILQIFIADSSSTTGAGLTGLLFNTASLTAYYHKDTDTTATAITLVTMTVGTFTSSGFKEIDATNMPGWYQFCPPDAALSTTGSPKSVALHLKGATNMAPLPIEIDLDAQADVTHWNGTAVSSPATAGIPDVNVKNINNVAAATPGASGGVLISGSNAGTTTLGALTITGATTHTGNVTCSDGITVTRSTANSNAIDATGSGSGAGISATGGAAVTTTAAGHGLLLTGGAASTGAGGVAGNAAKATGGAGAASVNGAAIGVLFAGGGTNTVASAAHGLSCTAASTGSGLNADTGTGATGSGIRAASSTTNGAGMALTGSGAQPGLSCTGGSSGNGATFTGVSNGHGVSAAGSGVGAGVLATGGGVSGPGVSGQGGGTGAGVRAVGGAAVTTTSAGPGILATGGGAATGAGGVAEVGLKVTGGAGAASTNGAASGAAFAGGGTNTVASAAHGLSLAGASTGSGLAAAAGATGVGVSVTTTAGDGISVTPTAGNALVLTANGTSKHGAVITGGTAGTSDGLKAVAGTGGVDVRGNITGNVTGNLSGSVGSVTAAVVLPSIPADWITAAGIAADAGPEIAAAVWDLATTGHTTSGTFGAAMSAAGAAGDPWSTSLPGSYGAGTAGSIVGNNLNATITSRMATYTQPTGFLAATFPTGTIANTTNITAGTITTVTNLTNLPAAPADWLTAAAVKADAVTKIQAGLSTYGGGDTAGTTTLLARLTATRAGLLDNLDAAVSSRSTYAGADTAGTTTLLSRVTAAVALATQIPANFTDATFASAGVFSTGALANAPTGGGGTVDANVVSVNGTAFTGAGVPSDRVMLTGVLGDQSLGDAVTVILPAGPVANGVLIGSRLRITSGGGQYQERTITTWNGTTKAAGIDTSLNGAAQTAGDSFAVLYDNAPQMDGAGNVYAVATVAFLTPAALAQFFTTDSTVTYASAVAGSVVKEIAANAGGSGAPTAAQNAAAIWDLATSGHTTSGTFGAAMNAAGSAGDPWSTAQPGGYAAGTYGYLVATDLPAILSKLNAAGLVITTSNPVPADGGVVRLVAADDYAASEGLTLTWNSTSTIDYAGAAVSLDFYASTALDAAVSLSKAGSVTGSVGAWLFSVNLTAADTALITATALRRKYALRALLANGHRTTPIEGEAVVTN